MTNYYELTARYDVRASFYGKAHIKETSTYYILISYETEILKLNKRTGELKFLCRDIWAFSQTTNRHINEFLKQFTNERAKTKKRTFTNGKSNIKKEI